MFSLFLQIFKFTLLIKNCVVIVNSKPTVEPYLDKDVLGIIDPVDRCRVANMPVQTIPQKKIFVMGDNRSESFDSRSFGPIAESLVVGRAFAVVWPFNRISTL
jgi:signal peptidase I